MVVRLRFYRNILIEVIREKEVFFNWNKWNIAKHSKAFVVPLEVMQFLIFYKVSMFKSRCHFCSELSNFQRFFRIYSLLLHSFSLQIHFYRFERKTCFFFSVREITDESGFMCKLTSHEKINLWKILKIPARIASLKSCEKLFREWK